MERGLQTDGLYPPFYFLWCHGDGKAVACGGDAALKAEMMDLTEKIMHPIFQLLFVA